MDDVFRHGDISTWVLNSGSYKFSSHATSRIPAPTFESLPAAIIIGTVCGALGALWVTINTYYHIFRKHYLNSDIMKVIEVSVLAAVTTSFAFWLPLTVQETCLPEPLRGYKLTV